MAFKVIENVLKDQIIEHLRVNKLIPPQHSGGLKFNSTSTNVLTLLDMWSKLLENDTDAVLLQLDQSAAYDVVSHEIMFRKLEILGFNENSLNLMKSYCSECKQMVMIEGYESVKKSTGKQSVMQGSVLSTLLYLVYVLDFPTLFHDTEHDEKQDLICKQPTGINLY